MIRQLNTAVLGDRYKARPNLHLGVGAEVAIGALRRVEVGALFEAANGSGGDGGGAAVATAAPAYAPPRAALSSDVTFTEPDLFEVQVFRGPSGWELVAAIELVSERNKDRDDARRSFAIKCSSYLQTGVSVVVVDIVTERLADLHLDLCELLDLPESFRWKSPTGLSAVCYRTVQGALKKGSAVGNGQVRLDVWPVPLAVGAELPTVPLRLAADLAVPLELELTYAAACRSLRIG
jgi:hypothetical protein